MNSHRLRRWLSLFLVLSVLATGLAAVGHSHDDLPAADAVCADCLHLHHHQAAPSAGTRLPTPVWSGRSLTHGLPVTPASFEGFTARARAPPVLA